ncbi:MAG: hypothetical protein ACHQ5A_02215 [Opitutales bacterium]
MPQLIRSRASLWRLVLLLGLPVTWVHATIVGLNQIVTPEIQPAGVLGLSAQVQHPSIGNSQQLQFELGLTPRLEVGWFQGLTPGEGFVGAEFNLLQAGPHLLTTGFINWSTRGGRAQPMLEYGCYTEPDHFVVGAISVDRRTELLLGYKRQLTERLAFSADFQSGTANSATVGFTYNFTSSLSINPAVYRTNSRSHHYLGYVVLTWNITCWK